MKTRQHHHQQQNSRWIKGKKHSSVESISSLVCCFGQVLPYESWCSHGSPRRNRFRRDLQTHTASAQYRPKERGFLSFFILKIFLYNIHRRDLFGKQSLTRLHTDSNRESEPSKEGKARRKRDGRVGGDPAGGKSATLESERKKMENKTRFTVTKCTTTTTSSSSSWEGGRQRAAKKKRTFSARVCIQKAKTWAQKLPKSQSRSVHLAVIPEWTRWRWYFFSLLLLLLLLRNLYIHIKDICMYISEK